MNRRPPSRRPRNPYGFLAGLLTVLVLPSLSLQAEAPERNAGLSEAPGPSGPAGAEAGLAPPGQRTGNEPYAVLADALFTELARRTEHEGQIEAWAGERGLDPASSAVQELVAAALDVEGRHSRRLTAEARQELLARYADDYAGLLAWRRETRALRYRAVGAAFGRWLEARSGEGYPPELLIDRLLTVYPPLVTRLTTGSAERRASVARDAQAFEEGLVSTMTAVPPRLMTR